MIRRWVPVAIGGGIVVWVVALALLAVTTRDSQEFGRLQPWILMVNAAGVLVLLALLVGRFVELVRDRRALVPGSRLRSQAVAMLSVLVLAPLLLVFTFSVLFLTRGIDSWFHVEVRQGLSDALGLSRAALDLRMREFVERTERIADDLGERRSTSLFSALDEHRRLSGAEELAVVGAGRIEAYSAASLTESVPPLPQDEVLLQARRGERYVSLDPLAGGGYVIRAAVRMGGSPGLQGPRVLLAVYPVPQRLADLAEAVQGAYQQYGRLSYLREPLKVSFVLTLSLVLLMALLAAVYGAFFFADRLVQPVQDLIGATRAVGKGDFDTRVQRASRDEIGYLVTSFNDMTKRLARARADAEASRQAVENERASLAVILARLSTGVISLEPDLTIRVANHAAGAILGADLQACSGERLEELAERQPLVAQLLAVIRPHVAAGQNDWREQVTLRHETGRRELMCACTALPGEAGDSAAGLVLVFDDITELLHAQREAAWGEVARRLAHEIRNPLTPIQLSAERVRRRLLAGLPERDAELLDRATNTIVQQVESMKQMVNAFSEYARAPALEMDYFDLNGLAREAAELYHAQDARVRVELSLADGGAFIEADRGRIRQVLNNLLTNSLEALEAVPDPAIAVRTARHPGPGAGFVELSVTDNGPGFHREFMGQVFDPYVTSKPKGTGLGLAIVRKIVEEHGGRIEAENDPGGGALVRVWLPADEAARGAPVPRPARNQEPRREHA